MLDAQIFRPVVNGMLAELEKQRASDKEKLQAELDDAKKKLEAALEASKVPPPAAEARTPATAARPGRARVG